MRTKRLTRTPAPPGQQPPGARGPLPTAAPRRAVWLAAWPVTAVFILSNTATPLYVLWQDELGFSSGTLTVIFAFYIVGLLAALLVAGVTSDRIGRKPVLLPALALGVMASVLFATAGSVTALAIARLLSGIAVGSIVSAGMAAVTDVAGPARKRLAALLASAAMVLGAGFGPLLAGVLSQTLPGPTVAVFFVEIVLLALAMLVVWRMPLTRPGAPSSGSWIRVPSVPGAQRTQLMMGIAVFGPGITSTSFVLSLGPSLLADVLDTSSRVVAGATAFVMFTAATAVQFAVQRLRVRTILLIGAASIVAGMAFLVTAVSISSAPLLAVSAVLAGAGQGLGQLGGLTLISSSVPAERLAEANAAMNVGGYVPAGLLPVVTGFLSDAVGLSAATTAFTSTLAVAAALGALYVATRLHSTI
ncbi:MFS transporter [Saccharopolyspora sp. K220]|uniref:MFS transporter n=1 Tax=Saccharopolyspora soli TaxID=2926618 RepID=UPI001F5967E1|nr:MFS transporter [Saccharopolyspora soli]MCI2420016.1 MFS transporter [Saccharopolyspora soli]